MIQSHDEGQNTVLELNGSFGPAEEERLQTLLRSLDPKKPVTIDFREVRLFHDLAVARLARDIGDLERRVSLIGLSEHHHRLLRYIGLQRMQPLA
jgi:hypothetical protein